RLVLILFCNAQGDLQLRAGRDGLAPLPEDATASQRRREQDEADRERGHRMAPYVLPESLGDRHRPGKDRLTIAPAAEGVSQLAGRGIAILRVFLQAFEADRLQVGVYEGVDRSRAGRLVFDDLPQYFHSGVGLEWLTPGEEDVEDRTQAVDIGADGD